MNKIGIGIIFALGLAFLIGGSVFVGIFPGILKNKINEELPLINGSDAYERWRETKVPITMKFHFFHLNNSDTFESLDDIELVEKGPYVYAEKRFKPDDQVHKIKDHQDRTDNLLSYRENRNYTFITDNKLDEKTELTIVNFPILGILQNVALQTTIKIINIYPKTYPDKKTLPNETALFIKSAPVKTLFEGMPYKLFRDPAMSLIGAPSKFSVFKGKNYLEEEWIINTGKYEIDQIGQLTSFDKRDSLTNGYPLLNSKIWPWSVNVTAQHNCSQLKGTDGTFFAPGISKDDILYAYEPQICRTIYFKYWKETEVKGITTWRYRVPQRCFESPQKNPDNTCYCIEDNIDECNRNGVMEISRCIRRTLGAPIVMSAPYYNHGDPELRNQSKYPLEPLKSLDDDNYGTYLDIEPMTGTTLKAVKRLQMNIKIKKQSYDTMPQLGKSSKDLYLVPVLWIEESGEADDAQADLFKSMLINKKKLANGISITFIVVGALMTIASVYLFIRR